MYDVGYDIENYTTIDPMFGSMADFEELISEMNKRGTYFNIKILLSRNFIGTVMEIIIFIFRFKTYIRFCTKSFE